jgi:hypothetical protein
VDLCIIRICVALFFIKCTCTAAVDMTWETPGVDGSAEAASQQMAPSIQGLVL